jgi:hypothetical protein
MTYDIEPGLVVEPSPGSPPGMTSSKTSKSSSFRSLHSDDNSVLADDSHFEDIGLDDDAVHYDSQHLRDIQIKPAPPNPYSTSYSADLRSSSLKQHAAARPQPSVKARPQRDITALPKSRPPFPSLQNHVRSINVRSTNTHNLSADQFPPKPSFRGLASRSTTSLPFARRNRSPSPNPNFSLMPRDPNVLMKPRRSSWQSNRGRKSAVELEKECDEDEGDDIPDGLVLDNVPISPRPPQERSFSRPSSQSPSQSPSPERAPKDRSRNVGNGTPPVAAAHGSLRSPLWKSETTLAVRSASGPPSPVKARAKSWNAALSHLSAEAKALTEKLEEHADNLDEKDWRPGQIGRPNTWDSPRRSVDRIYEQKDCMKSSLPELPPLRRTNIMIDPLPISKEKEAVLSRTRPSWLPPKDPAEERRHLREYQKMMAQSAEMDRRRDAARRAKSACRDSAADNLIRIWADDIIPRWNDAIRERRTRELWWRGVAPRSRGVVWSRAIGNELGLTETSFQAALARAREAEARVAAGKGDTEDTRRTAWLAAIRKDINEVTFNDLRIFQPGGPLHGSLVDVLSAYAFYRSDIGYISGCNVSLMSMFCPRSDLFLLTLTTDHRRSASPQPAFTDSYIHHASQRA